MSDLIENPEAVAELIELGTPLASTQTSDDPGDVPDVKRVPCSIFTVGGLQFRVEGFDAWGYMAAGVFATGYWAGPDGKRLCDDKDVLIPYGNLGLIEFDFAALERQEGQDDNAG